MSDALKEKIQIGNVSLLTEYIPYVDSVSIGLWIGVGSRYETIQENGFSHFLEHMLFKGTKKRSPLDIAGDIDRVGGQMNAATNREYTYYYVSVMSDYIDIALDVLSDIFYNSTFDNEELEREKAVVLEEIKMYEDTPDEWIHDIFLEDFFPNSALGRPILGKANHIMSLQRQDIVKFYETNYLSNNIILSVAGNFDKELLIKNVKTLFEKDNELKDKYYETAEQQKKNINIIEKELNQLHFCLGTKTISNIDDRRFALYVISTILGGSMSSRLFQSLREKQGLCYSVYSFYSLFKETGIFAIYSGLSPDNFKPAISSIMKEIDKLKKRQISEEELNNAKNFLKGNFALSMESTESRMMHMAKNELVFSRFIDKKEILKKIESVSLDDVFSLIDYMFTGDYVFTALGQLDKKIVEEFI